MKRQAINLMAFAALLVLAAVGRAQTFHGQLTAEEKKKVHTVKMEAGKVYQVDLISKVFDPFLWLQDAAGKDLLLDDDGGDGLNARLTFAPAVTADFKLVAGSFTNTGKGAYSLVVEPLP